MRALDALRLWRLSLAEWRAHPWRQLAALLSVALGVALALSVHLINGSALAEFSSAVRSANGEPDLSLQGGATGLPESWLDTLAATPGVAVASPRVHADTVLLLPGGRTHPVRVIGVDALSVMAVAPELLPQPAKGSGRLAMLDPRLGFANAALQGLIGQVDSSPAAADWQVLARGKPWQLVAGGQVAAGGGPILVVDIAAAQAMLGQPGQLSRVDVRLQAGADAASVQRALAGQLPPGAQWLVPGDGNQRVSNLSRAYRVNLSVLALVALVVGGFLVFSVVSLAVAQRTPGLALLGVLGLGAAGRRGLVLAECAVTGVLAGLLGVALGTGMAMAALRLLAGDLGGGYFAGVAPQLQWSWPAAALCVGLGLLASVVGGAWPAAQAARLSPAMALKGLGGQGGQAPPVWPGLLMLVGGAGLALLPPIEGLPVAAYAAVAAWLVGGISLLPAVVRVLLGQRGASPARHALWLLALQRARHHRGTATAALAGVVASLALCVALTVMVASFRSAVTTWLDTVLPADLYVRAGQGAGGDVTFPDGLAQRLASVPGVARVAGMRQLQVSLSPRQPEVSVLARDLGDDPSQQLPLVDVALPLPAGQVGLFVSEAMLSLHNARIGQPLTLVLPSGPVTFFARGVYRDYARQFGSVTLDEADYRRLTGDERLNDMALWLQPGAAQAPLQAAIRAVVAELGGAPQALTFASTAQLKAISLQIFDRSFAVTRYLQVVAIAIGLAGVAASLSAQVLSRQREFGLLAHLGLTRSQVMRLVLLETAGWLIAGVLVGLGLGLAISAVLVHVVNPQSFHWTMPLLVPPGPVAALLGAVLLAGLGTTLLTARRAVHADAVRAVREDW